MDWKWDRQLRMVHRMQRLIASGQPVDTAIPFGTGARLGLDDDPDTVLEAQFRIIDSPIRPDTGVDPTPDPDPPHPTPDQTEIRMQADPPSHPDPEPDDPQSPSQAPPRRPESQTQPGMDQSAMGR